MSLNSNQDLGEQVVTKIVEIGLDKQLETIKNVEIQLDSEIFDLLQGKLNAIQLKANQIVTPDDLSLETIEFSSNRISVDVIETILAGKTHLNEPIEANLVVSLTEQDLNQTINSQIVRQWLNKIEFSTAKITFSLQLKQAEIFLLESNHIKLFLEFTVYTNNQPKLVAVDLDVGIEREKTIILKKIAFLDKKELSLVYITTILNKIAKALKSDWLKVANAWIKIETIKVISERLKLGLQVHIPATSDK